MINTDDNKLVNQSFYIKLIIDDLLKSDFEKALRNIKNYLKTLNKSEYEFLFLDLIKISFMEKDLAFAKLQLELNNIVQDDYQFNLPNYVLTFYHKLAKNEFNVARAYLDIIKNMAQLGHEFIFISEMTKLLEMSEEKSDLNYDFSLAILDRRKAQLTENISQNNSAFDANYWAKQLLYKKYKILKIQGMVLLKPISHEKEEAIFKEILKYDDVEFFIIGKDENRQIVLRYYLAKKCINDKQIIELANQAYNEGNYDECIRYYLELLSYNKPRAIVYAKLGEAYLKKNNRILAIDFLTVANELSKQEGINYDYTQKISRIKQSVNSSVRKK